MGLFNKNSVALSAKELEKQLAIEKEKQELEEEKRKEKEADEKLKVELEDLFLPPYFTELDVKTSKERMMQLSNKEHIKKYSVDFIQLKTNINDTREMNVHKFQKNIHPTLDVENPVLYKLYEDGGFEYVFDLITDIRYQNKNYSSEIKIYSKKSKYKVYLWIPELKSQILYKTPLFSHKEVKE